MGARIKAAASYGASLAVVAVTAYLLASRGIRPVYQLALAAVAASLAVLGGMFLIKSEAFPKEKIKKATVTALFAIYLLLLLNFTIFDGYFGRDASEKTVTEFFAERGNLVPLATLVRQTRALADGRYDLDFYVVNIVGNIAAFAPLAVFLPALFEKCRRFLPFFLVTSAAIIAVESAQLFLRVGSYDVDDYMLNIAGAVALFFILKTKRLSRITSKIYGGDTACKDENNV